MFQVRGGFVDKDQLLRVAELVRLMADTVRRFIPAERALDGEMLRLSRASIALDAMAAELDDIAGPVGRA